ncbi:MAG: hypothetical protein AB7I38_14630 [Dehalococcoidia bacterium]
MNAMLAAARGIGFVGNHRLSRSALSPSDLAAFDVEHSVGPSSRVADCGVEVGFIVGGRFDPRSAMACPDCAAAAYQSIAS